jgi:hypothetical protein
MSLPTHPNREIYNEFQRVILSNRFIFTQGAIIVGVLIILGPIGMIAYMGGWGVLFFLALAFERPYRILRTLWPHGNWPPQVVALPTRWKVRSLVAVFLLIFFYSAAVWTAYRVLIPMFGAKVGDLSDDTCIGLVCMLLK